MIINASAARQRSDDVNSYAYSKIADAIRDATYRGEYSCQVILSEKCTIDTNRNYREFLEELGYNVDVERELETDDFGENYYNVTINIRWGE